MNTNPQDNNQDIEEEEKEEEVWQVCQWHVKPSFLERHPNFIAFLLSGVGLGLSLTSILMVVLKHLFF